MNEAIKISSIHIYHPENIRNNQYYFDKYPNVKNLPELLNDFGQKQRYITIQPDENALTMSINALAPISDKDIDVLIFASTTMEYLSPLNALYLHHHLALKNECVCIDINGNCLGMLMALEQAAIILKMKKTAKKALIVASDHLSNLCNQNELFPSVLFGDAAVAMTLEKVQNGTSSGLMDSFYYTDSSFCRETRFPKHGFSQSQNMQDEKIYWGKFTTKECLPHAIYHIDKLLKNNGLTIDDISCFFFSQVMKSNISELAEALNIPNKKIEYIADEYGYTGATSPFIAYYCHQKKNLLRDEDIVLFWTLGAGYQFGIVLWKI
ncbi:3-oxoacyl-ACP synthase [Providencia sp. PROV188]|uniref:3-oxoacyl-ACP synthase III family protein n=1 Tax=Providencia TaxID=586 RepID=UPI0003E2355B|nr:MULTISPECIES: 3-oxoacyl-[acyl-carrier-protein] synthase III C-terminal domain-containing protein [Providencia]ETT03018.1 3-oxoacyl-[acyl-carrier-protein (ACP)] synthase III [Providencia alcalifaciens PAL-3]EUC98255.1 3-oxoacyl-[acyl-carrier-protein (ACP)] synthase III [Providencia alcalifaciens PAL-1]MTB44356.1 3-oxoacyl-ACP synthase [Providencia sp. wls1950]MTC42533.1 3-oxoacyl-ACP synthase [Providencia sp. wls1921]MTC47302.1 3-oxoacyl-ACP synthase [Providencia sp. wls1922]